MNSKRRTTTNNPTSLCLSSLLIFSTSMRALRSLTSPSLHPNPNRNSTPNHLRYDHFFVARVETRAAIAVTGAQKNPNRSHISRKKVEKEDKEKQKEEELGHVRCDVQVISWRERAVHASIVVNADVDSVWSVLTDYERLADFIPNLIYSGRIPCPHEGRIWLEQRGLQRALYWHIEARVVLDLQEIPNSVNGRELHFSMVDGDFKKFEGKWSVIAGTRPATAKLSYEVNVIPRLHFPAILLERIIRSDLPTNLEALAFWAEKKCKEITDVNSNCIDLKAHVSSLKDLSGVKKLNSDTSVKADGALNGKKWGIYGNTCRVDRPCVVDEIHLRNFDGLLENGGTHRCVYASITVKAPVREVWNVLTAYEELPEIVPNLAISKVVFRDNNKVRILQEGCKGLLYMVLHARVVLDLNEELEKEISFEQVEGDFDSFQGRWRLEQLGDHHTLLKYMVETKMHQDTFLSEAIVEEVIYEDLPSNLCAIRDYAEKIELAKTGSIDPPVTPTSHDPDSLQFLQKSLADQVPIFQPSKSANSQRPKVPGLQTDMEVLKSEILGFISTYGQDGFMPMRKQLRQHGRVDVEKAITKMGGFRKVAGLMNLSLAYKDRKPKGYWDNLENLHVEIRRFQRNWGMDPTFMPSRKSFERAVRLWYLANNGWVCGRYDIARALEKWGGLQEVSRLLSLQLRRTKKRSSSDEEDDPLDYELGTINGSKVIMNKASSSQDAQKWIANYQDLDID